jgi:hypothetical protein
VEQAAAKTLQRAENFAEFVEHFDDLPPNLLNAPSAAGNGAVLAERAAYEAAERLAQSKAGPGIVIAGTLPNGAFVIATSGKPALTIVNAELATAAANAGGLGNIGKHASTTIGACAEFKVVEKLSLKFDGFKLEDIIWSNPYRPRDIPKIIPPCANCKAMGLSNF